MEQAKGARMSPARAARQRKGFWLTVFAYGSSTSVCSRHSSKAAAIKAALACEKRGGAFEHRLWFVRESQIKRKAK
jgi:hypothetical protein